MKTNSFRSLLAHSAMSLFLTSTALIATAQEDLWPVRFEANGTKYQVFAPQPESITGERFTARMAVGVERAQDAQPVFGAIWGDGVLALESGARIGTLSSFTVTDARFPSLSDEAELLAIREAISSQLPRASGPISTSWLTAALNKEQKLGNSFANDAPEIIYTEKPSALVFIDGTPRYEKLKETMSDDNDPVYATTGGVDIERVMNTPYMIMRPVGGDHYLYGSKLWFRSRDIVGPWKQVENVPKELRAIGEKAESTAEITASEDQTKVPEIVVRTTPAELLDLDGPPQFEPVQNTSLLYATNTNRNFFLDINSQQYYLLASGRWFATGDPKNGPWAFVPSDKLPASFASIPEGSKKDAVLAHISGTDAALDASREANVPKTAQIDRSTASVAVTYQGSPEFERIAGTNVEYARNASTNVLRINGRYYVCDNAVWFEGDSPDGPWMVSTQVPAEVSSIPPSSPVYNVRYVYIYDSTPQYVYGGYTPGYLGNYGYGGSVFYGTGFYYGGGWGNYYNPWPSTWGFGMCYDPWNGWGFGGGWGWGWYYPHHGFGHHGFGHHGFGHGWWGSAYHNPHYYDPHHGGFYGHHNNGYGGNGHHGYRAQSSHASRPAGVYAGRERNGIRNAPVARATPRGTNDGARADANATRPMTKPASQSTFTDARGNTFGTKPDAGAAWARSTPQERIAPVVGRTQPGRTEQQVQRPITDARGNAYRPNTGEAVRNTGATWNRVDPPTPLRSDNNNTRPYNARPEVQSRPNGTDRPAYQQSQQRQTPERNYNAPSNPRNNGSMQRGGGGSRPQQAAPSRSNSAPRSSSSMRSGGGGNSGGSMRSGGGGGGSRSGGSGGGGSRSSGGGSRSGGGGRR